MEITLIILTPLILWIVSLLWLSRWTKFWLFFAINLLLFIGYMTFLINSDLEFLGTDPYGLGQMALIVIVIIGHVVAGFIFAIFKRRQLNQANKI